jgi:HAE1 family hydrophobic/amphiphilic exporter-1
LRNGAAVLIIALILAGGGMYSFLGLKSELLPDIGLPQLSITTVYPGASAEDVNKKVTIPLENALKGAEGVEDMTSNSLESVSRISLNFPFGTDMDKSSQKIQEVLDGVGLPAEVQKPSISRFSFGSFPIMNFALFPVDESKPIDDWVVNTLKTDLEKIEGVNTAAISGVTKNFLEITVNNARAAQYGISLQSIRDSVSGAFFAFPAGTIMENEIKVPIHVERGITKLDELRSILLRAPLTNTLVRLSDVASIQQKSERAEISRYNGKESISLLITKKQDANTVQVAKDVLKQLDANKNTVSYAVIFDQAAAVDNSIKELISKGLFGALFAALTVLIFLRNVRATLIAILSIPLSLLIAAIFLRWWGITLNVMSLAGMTVAVGRVVDDSIIVIENIFRKIVRDPNTPRNETALQGTKEMISAVLSSTITTVVVFLPLGFVGGVAGEIFFPFALTIVVALLASLVVSITLVPFLAKISFRTAKHVDREPFYVRWYEKVIRFSLKEKWLVLLLAPLMLIGSGFLFQQGGVGFVFLPNEKVKIIQASFVLPASTSLSKTNEVSLNIEKQLAQNPQYLKRSISLGNFDFASGTTLPNRGTYFIELAEGMDVAREVGNVQAIFEQTISPISKDATWSVSEQQGGGPPSNNFVTIDLYSNDLEKLEQASAQVTEVIAKREDVKQVTNNLQQKQRQWSVMLNGEAMQNAGVSSFVVLGIISDRTRPIDAGVYTLDGVDSQIRLRYETALNGADEIGALTVFGTAGPRLLRDLARIEPTNVYTSIQKFNGRTFAQITAQSASDNIRTTTQEITEAVKKLELPEGVSLESGGGSDETVQLFIDLGIAMAIAIGLVYLTMLIFFGKLRVPFIILTSLLFVPIGAIIGLIATDEPLSLSAMIGFLMLIGIVVTNAIVMVDRINQNRDAGMPIREALIESGKTRLRPILMTAIATIAALSPLVFSTPEGGIISRGLAVVVVGGLTTSTLLTVIFLPVVYELAFFRTHRRQRQEVRTASASSANMGPPIPDPSKKPLKTPSQKKKK